MKNTKEYYYFKSMQLGKYTGAAVLARRQKRYRRKDRAPMSPAHKQEKPSIEAEALPAPGAIVCADVSTIIAVFRWFKASATPHQMYKHCAWTVFVMPGKTFDLISLTEIFEQ